MRVLILGAAGMIGRKLTQSILAKGNLGGQPVLQLDLADIIKPSVTASGGIETYCAALELSDGPACRSLIARRPDVIVHLAAIVSGEAEQDFDKGYRVNLDGSRILFEAIRAEGLSNDYIPKVLFSSSIAVFGKPFEHQIEDDFLSAPLSSYGTQKAMSELLVSDYTRRGIFDGLSMRLPTICIRPGKPNAAASGFFSNILREPLVGKTANLPVSKDTRHWHASPRSAVGFFHHAAALDLQTVGPRRALNLPGLSATVGEQIEALKRVAGSQATSLITEIPDADIAALVENWPENFNPQRALNLGFVAETDFDQIIQAHIQDELSD